jgi:hypothetical protein
MFPPENISSFRPLSENHARFIFLLCFLHAADKHMYLDSIHVINYALRLQCQWSDIIGSNVRNMVEPHALLDFMNDAAGLLGYTPAELARGTSTWLARVYVPSTLIDWLHRVSCLDDAETTDGGRASSALG